MQRGADGPIAIETRLGWVLSCPVVGITCEQSVTNFVSTYSFMVDALSVLTNPDAELRRFWELESPGLRADEETVHDKFTQRITVNNHRYEVSLPWRQGHPRLPVNFELCRKRLCGLLKRLQQTPELLQEYDDIISDQLKNYQSDTLTPELLEP